MKFFTRFLIIFSIFTSCVFIQSDANKIIFERENRDEPSSTIAEIAQELVQKPRSNQVLSLNLSALLLLLLLKAAAFGAAYIGGYDRYRGRNLEGANLVSEDEMTLALGYLIGDTCLYRAACEAPDTAKEYLGTIDIAMEAMKLFPQTSHMNSQYGKKLKEFRKAIEYGERNQCPPEYTCKKANIDKFLHPE